MEWALKDRAGIGRCVCRRMTRRIDWMEEGKEDKGTKDEATLNVGDTDRA